MQKKFFAGAVVKKFKLNDAKEIQLGISHFTTGSTVHVVGLTMSDVTPVTDEEGYVIENANGLIMYKLNTEDALLKGIRLLYDCGWDIDWEDSPDFVDVAMKFVPHNGTSLQKAVGWVWMEDPDFIAEDEKCLQPEEE